jgi:hypothetical protein
MAAKGITNKKLSSGQFLDSSFLRAFEMKLGMKIPCP